MQKALMVLVLALFVVSCSGKSHKSATKPQATPQIVSSQPGSSPGSGGSAGSGTGPPPLIISSGSGNSFAFALGYSGNPTQASVLPGLTVQHTETATVPADQAFVTAAIQGRGSSGPLPFASLSQTDQAQTTAALTAVGVKQEDINFGSSLNSGPFPSITVKTSTSDLPNQGKKIVDAIESVLGRSQSGVRFGLSDCRAALEPLRQKAMAGAAEEAKSIAAGSSLTPGAITAVSQSTTPSVQVGPTADPCNAGASNGFALNLAALDAKAEVSLTLQVSVTYSLGAATNTNGITATGSGTATAKADEAYVVVVTGGPYNSGGGQQVTSKNRSDLTQKLTALKLDPKDLQIGTSPNNTGQIIVGMEVPIDRLPQAGKDVVAAVEDVLGRSQTQGVWFTHSNCAAVLSEARKQAAVDANRNAQGLAADAQVKLGSLIVLSEVPSSAFGGSANSAPCDDNLINRFGYSYGNSDIVSFDAPAQFTVKTGVTEVYGVGQ